MVNHKEAEAADRLERERERQSLHYCWEIKVGNSELKEVCNQLLGTRPRL